MERLQGTEMVVDAESAVAQYGWVSSAPPCPEHVPVGTPRSPCPIALVTQRGMSPPFKVSVPQKTGELVCSKPAGKGSTSSNPSAVHQSRQQTGFHQGSKTQGLLGGCRPPWKESKPANKHLHVDL